MVNNRRFIRWDLTVLAVFRVWLGGDYWKAKAFAFDDFGKSQRIKVVQLGHEIKKNVFTSMKWSLRNLDALVVTRNKKQENKDDLFDAPCMMCHI